MDAVKGSNFEADSHLPHFGSIPFGRITANKIKQFILKDLLLQSGTNAGKRLSKQRIQNIMIPFREIWTDACIEYNWKLPDPFIAVQKKNLPRKNKVIFKVYRYDEIVKILDCMDPHYMAISKFFLITGLMSSELAGIKKDAIADNQLSVSYKVTRVEEGHHLKNEYRTREIPITHKMGEILNAMASKNSGDFVFTLKNGKPFTDVAFRKVWMAASKKAGVEYRKPYTTRHTFVAWARVLGIYKDRLVNLMGHNSTKMVEEVYGRYVKKLEQDHDDILRFFGEDFLAD